MCHKKFQPNIPSGSGGKTDFIGFVIFSNGGHLGFSTRLNFNILKPCNIVILHVKFKNHGYQSGSGEKVDFIGFANF